MDLPDGSDGKESVCNAGDRGSIPGSGRREWLPWRREWLPKPVFLPGESHARLPGIEPTSLSSLALAERFFTTSATWEVPLTLRWLSLPWRRARQPTPVFLPGESHGHRSLAGHKRVRHNWSDIAWMHGSLLFKLSFTLSLHFIFPNIH